MKKSVSIVILVCFIVTGQVGACPVYAQAALPAGSDFLLPAPGTMVPLSPEFTPPILKGIKIHPDNPFRFDFILDKGDDASLATKKSLNEQSTRLIKYFLASLTIPENDLWVNLSPYEKNRIIPPSFGQTEMGRDLLAEDYMLKQITASLIYPEGPTGKKFWRRIYEEASKKFGTTNIPVNTFNKVWIVPEKAVVYENTKAGTAYVVEAKLKVLMEQDYLSRQKHLVVPDDVASMGANIVREIVIPELTREVNEDKNFSQLRQVYNSLILATWYKKKIRDSILEQVYADKNKVAGVGYGRNDVEFIYQRYLQAFKKGAYNYIKEDIDPATQQHTPRKYFSGGTNLDLDGLLKQSRVLPDNISLDNAMIVQVQTNPFQIPHPAKSEILNGLTILRFSHSMSLTGGVEMYISELDRILLQRNKVTIIQVFYTTDKHLKDTETKVGEGRLIQIPVFYNSEGESTENLIKAHLINFVKSNGLDGKIRKLLALNNLQKILKFVPVVRKYYQVRPRTQDLKNKLREILRKYKVDLIINHSPNLLNEGLIINEQGAKYNIPIIIQNHVTNRLFSQDKIFLGALAKISSHITTVSSLDIPETLKSKTTVLWDGIDTDFFDPEKVSVEQEDSLKKEYGILTQDKIVLLPARIDPLKGQLDILKALLISQQRNVHYKVFLVGENQSRLYQSQIEDWDRKNGMNNSVVLAGNSSKDRLRVMYKISDVVVLPSASEGLPRILLEAQAMKKPVVAYSNDGMREAVIDGKTGYLVKDKDYDGLANAVEALLKNGLMSKAIGEAGREFVKSKFSLTALAQRHEEFYIKIIKLNTPHGPMEPVTDQAMNAANLPGPGSLGQVDLKKDALANARLLLKRLNEKKLSWGQIEEMLGQYNREIFRKSNHDFNTVNQGIRTFLQRDGVDEGAKNPFDVNIINISIAFVDVIQQDPNRAKQILKTEDGNMPDDAQLTSKSESNRLNWQELGLMIQNKEAQEPDGLWWKEFYNNGLIIDDRSGTNDVFRDGLGGGRHQNFFKQMIESLKFQIPKLNIHGDTLILGTGRAWWEPIDLKESFPAIKRVWFVDKIKEKRLDDVVKALAVQDYSNDTYRPVAANFMDTNFVNIFGARKFSLIIGENVTIGNNEMTEPIARAYYQLLAPGGILYLNNAGVTKEFLAYLRDEKKGTILESRAGYEVLFQKKIDAVMLNENRGGIDLTPAKMNLETQNAGEGIRFHLDPALLRQLQDAPGFVPVIINIQPLMDLRGFLGVNLQENTPQESSKLA